MLNEYNEEVSILYDKEVKLEIIESKSNTTGYMISEIDEIVYLLDGQAILEVLDEKINLEKGSSYLIKKNTKHKVIYTSHDCKWLCVHIKEKI